MQTIYPNIPPLNMPIYILEGVTVMVLNATFKNISVMSWRSVLLVEETGVPEENYRPAAIHWQAFRKSFTIINILIIRHFELQFTIGNCLHFQQTLCSEMSEEFRFALTCFGSSKKVKNRKTGLEVTDNGIIQTSPMIPNHYGSSNKEYYA